MFAPSVTYRAELHAQGMRMLEITPDPGQLLGQPLSHCLEDGWWWQCVHPEDRNRAFRQPAGNTSDEPVIATYRHIDPAGRIRWVEDRRVVTGDGQVLGSLRCVTPNRTAGHHAPQPFAEAFFRHSLAAGVLLDGERRILAANPAFCGLFGRSEDDMIGRGIFDIYPNDADEAIRSAIWQEVAGRGRWTGDLPVEIDPGRPRVLSISINTCNDAEAVRYIVTVVDATRERELAGTIDHMNSYDMATGVRNRGSFIETVDRRIRDSGGATGMAVLAVTLARYSLLRHALGGCTDVLMHRVARRLHWVTNGRRVVLARVSDDTLAIGMEGGSASVEETAQRIQRIMQRSLVIDGNEWPVPVRIGIAFHPRDGHDATELLAKADAAQLAGAEHTGATAVYHTPEPTDAVRRRLLVEQRLGVALRDGALHLVYQPQWDPHRAVITGVEALLRWHDPMLGDVSPGEFIPLAEETGHIHALGQWVLHRACHEAARWTGALADVRVAVNLSVRQIQTDSLLESVQAALADSGLDATRLELEVTEGLAVTDGTTVRDVLSRLRGIGCRVAIDDFGTGYASLSQLADMPFDTLKIDRSLVAAMAGDPKRPAVVAAIVAMGRSLGFRTIAEGVESAEQARALMALGVDEVQGFHYAGPLSGRALQTWCDDRE
ncbi:bifunctional diguanylate cyclase/phosphodiesterase [Arhodomonas sp. KWT]|uniref:putative bifunctional diguanylate cyclase/phosphodiesterase n=1 Tax=Arhodomonas sp. KWT TaxID=2679915 RepID=UPI0013D165ED|nr:GGDEF domain-containing phosphodiesterase [Arhodomonas sp. KWT]